MRHLAVWRFPLWYCVRLWRRVMRPAPCPHVHVRVTRVLPGLLMRLTPRRPGEAWHICLDCAALVRRQREPQEGPK